MDIEVFFIDIGVFVYGYLGVCLWILRFLFIDIGVFVYGLWGVCLWIFDYGCWGVL